MTEWKIYKPVTEFGKNIASLLKYDNGVRLEIHEYLENVEPELIQLKKDADRYNEMFLTDTVRLSEVGYMDIMARARKWDEAEIMCKTLYDIWNFDTIRGVDEVSVATVLMGLAKTLHDNNVIEKAEKWDYLGALQRNAVSDWITNEKKLDAIREISFDEKYDDDPYVGEARALKKIREILDQ